MVSASMINADFNLPGILFDIDILIPAVPRAMPCQTSV